MTAPDPNRYHRPVACHICGEPLFYMDDPRHEPEITAYVTRDGRPPDTIYAHAACWDALGRTER